LTIAELAQQQHATEVLDPEGLTADIWESDEELDAFLTDFRLHRDASVG